MSKQNIVSNEAYQKLLADLDYLKTVKRPEVQEAIKKAREYGDLSENSEYDEAKNEQARVEEAIKKLEEEIANSVILDEASLGTETVSVGNVVEVRCLDNGKEYTYQIVGTSTEANPATGFITDDCPLGKGFMNQKRGAHVVIETPGGVRRFTILDIRKPEK
ncbi:MAG: transcription elongation factor GreA [Clostridia bacterium]|nr:transcription elongation factor GreA [Clostridia bacterium]